MSVPAPDRVSPQRAALADRVRSSLRDVADFPAPGVLFKDFTPLLLDADLTREVVADMAGRHHGQVDRVAGIEARGFILGAVIAHTLGVGFVPVRKSGKLPARCHTVDYALEYGSATLQLHVDAMAPGDRVLVVDDVLATGGTAAATCELVRRCGGEVRAVEVVLELGFLGGRDRLSGLPVQALLTD